jgi:hypothetical protein
MLRYVVIALVGAVIVTGAVTAFGALRSTEQTFDGLTRKEAERAARSGRMYDVRQCPPPRRVECRAAHDHWLCTVTFPDGARVSGDPAPRQAQIVSAIC